MNDSSSFKSIRFQLNRESREANVEPHLLLSDFLRDHLGLKGTRKSCEVEICGACTVLVDGRPVSSCATPAFEIDGPLLFPEAWRYGEESWPVLPRFPLHRSFRRFAEQNRHRSGFLLTSAFF